MILGEIMALVEKPKSPETIDLLLARRSLSAKNMVEPAPTSDELETILRCGIRVPDHKKLAPWRIQVVQGDARLEVGQVFADIFKKNNPTASAEQIQSEANRATRAPLLLIVSTHITNQKVPRIEQVLSGGAVCQNLIIATNALGYYAQWVTEWVAFDEDVKMGLGIDAEDEILGYIYIGSAEEAPTERERPNFDDVITYR
jgi:nitroreductase